MNGTGDNMDEPMPSPDELQDDPILLKEEPPPAPPKPRPPTMLARRQASVAPVPPEPAPIVTVPTKAVSMLDAAVASGSSTLALTKKEDALLGAAVRDEEVEIRPDGIVYMSHARLRMRLNEALGRGQWALLPVGEPLLERDQHRIHRVYRFLVRGVVLDESMGEQEYHPGSPTMSYADALEGCKSNALSRCAKSLSIGLELWDKRWIHGWRERNAVQVRVKRRDGSIRQEWRRKDMAPLQGELSPEENGGARLAAPGPTQAQAPAPAQVAAASAPNGGGIYEEVVTTARGAKVTIQVHTGYDEKEHCSKGKLMRLVVAAMVWAREKQNITDRHEQGVWAHDSLTALVRDEGIEHYSLVPWKGDLHQRLLKAFGVEDAR